MGIFVPLCPGAGDADPLGRSVHSIKDKGRLKSGLGKIGLYWAALICVGLQRVGFLSALVLMPAREGGWQIPHT